MVIKNIIQSKDKISRKYIQETEDYHRIETMYIDYCNKNIICFSTQVGCNMGCKFCYNGLKNNFKRNLTYDEICKQIENILKIENIQNDKAILFSAMGIGEPLLNYDNLTATFHYLNNKYKNSKFALATCGVNLDSILKLAKDLKDINNFKLTISLHSALPDKRKSIMPSSNDLDILFKTVKKYKTISGRNVEWNYVLFESLNDSKEDAKALFELLGRDEYIKINRFNIVENSTLQGSKNVEKFISELKKYGMQVEYYETNGEDINGACGQMIS